MNQKKNRQEHIAKVLAKADIEALIAIMQELENAGRTEILSALNKELTDASKNAAVSKIQQAAVVADGKMKAWVAPATATAYVEGANAIDTELAKFGIKTAAGDITLEVLRSSPKLAPHLQAVNSLISDAYLDFGNGMTGFVRGAQHTLNDAFKRQVQSKLGLGRLQGADIRTIKNEIKDLLSERGFEVLIDRGGKQWTLSRYSEMLSRTHLIKANTEATINRAAEYEIDVFEVSTHGATDDLCGRQEGKLYSLSGKKYPKLTPENTPPFHPNCKHTLLPRPDLDSIADVERPVPEDIENKTVPFEDVEPFEAIDEKKQKTVVDTSGSFGVKGNKATVFGADLPLNKVEQEVMKDVAVRHEYSLTASGRKERNQPAGVFIQRKDGSNKRIIFPPSTNKNRTYGEVARTFYHEVGHAVDFANDAQLRKRLFDAPTAEIRNLVSDRLVRNTAGLDKYNLSEAGLRDYVAGRKVFLDEAKTKYIQLSRQKKMYYSSSAEVFAESYMLYRVEPEKLRKLSPSVYKIMKDVTK